MRKKLIKTKIKKLSGIELTQYVNEAQGTEYEQLGEAIVGLGVGIVSIACGAALIGAVATGMGIVLGGNSAYKALKGSFDDDDLYSLVKKMDDDDVLIVTTKKYELSSHNGNMYSISYETTFEIE